MNADALDMQRIAQDIKAWGMALGFQQVGITDTDLQQAESRLQLWLDQGLHGEMNYMHRHGLKRSRPALLHPGTLRVISLRMDYLADTEEDLLALTEDPIRAFISRYALGRDYHKVLRHRLQQLADRITKEYGPFGYRVFTDSAPVMEKPLAEKAGLGWIGKHTNLINSKAGSWFFLGELYVDLPLPLDTPASVHCGQCTSCISICPTHAIVAPYVLDARRCISYLTIELQGSIPVEFRSAMGNRIYGCDDCQAICPWNRFAVSTSEQDFMPRHQLDQSLLLELWDWDERMFLNKTEGSAIRRLGYERWRRNLAIALGNAKQDKDRVIQALQAALPTASTLVTEHLLWALEQLTDEKR